MQRIVSSSEFGAVRDQPEKPTTFLYIYNEQMKHAYYYPRVNETLRYILKKAWTRKGG